MKVTVIGSTKVGYKLPTNEAVQFGARSAGICYMPDNFEAILTEDPEKTAKRIKQTLGSGHHSVYDHPTYNLLLEDVPKFLAMVLNNEGMYTTSEKSARYTRMNPTPDELELYNKWMEIFKAEIQSMYPFIKDTQAQKLAQENARYLISVFTPTTMEYTTSLRQINYINAMMRKYCENEPDTDFSLTVKVHFADFMDEIRPLIVDGLDCNMKGRKLSLFDSPRERDAEFGENYSTNYYGTFAMLAQAQRHRTIDYKMYLDENNMAFYTPLIIRKENNSDRGLEDEWLKDIKKVASRFPQGTLVKINERGTYENFMLKCTERLCGCAQLEIMLRTRQTLKYYIEASGESSGMFQDFISKGYGATTRCRFPSWQCKSPCIWGPDKAFDRLI